MTLPYLTGNEPWLKACRRGAQIYVQKWGDKGTEWWWPLTLVDMDTGLARIDVCGKSQNVHLDDYARLRIEGDEIVESEDFQNPLTAERLNQTKP